MLLFIPIPPITLLINRIQLCHWLSRTRIKYGSHRWYTHTHTIWTFIGDFDFMLKNHSPIDAPKWRVSINNNDDRIANGTTTTKNCRSYHVHSSDAAHYVCAFVCVCVRYQACMYLWRVLFNANTVLNKNRRKKIEKTCILLVFVAVVYFPLFYTFQIVWWFIYSLTCDQTGNCFDFLLSPSPSLVVRSIFVICETLLITVHRTHSVWLVGTI